MANRQTWHVLYWIMIGGLIGLGLLSFDIVFLAVPCLIAGLGLGAFGIMRWGTSRLWAALLGFGILPALILLNDIIRAYPPCTAQGLTLLANTLPGTSVSCGALPTAYYILFACFVIVALVGGVWPILHKRTHR